MSTKEQGPEERKLILGLAKEAHGFAKFAFDYPLFLWTICIIAVILVGSFSYATWINPHKPEYVILAPSAADVLRERALARSPFRHCLHISEEEQYHCARTVLAMRDEQLKSLREETPEIPREESPPVKGPLITKPHTAKMPNVAAKDKEQKVVQPRQCFEALTTNCGRPSGSPGRGENGGSSSNTGIGFGWR
jgi:hypothetical protein